MVTSKNLLQIGFVSAPNNIHELPGTGWYACGPNIPTTNFNEEIRLIEGNLSIWTTKHYQRPDNTFTFSISGIVTEIKDIDQLKEYCLTNGRISTGGIGPSSVYNVWD